MKRGIYLAPFDELMEPRLLAELARSAEARGWDGFFLWDHIRYREPVQAVADPWVALAAIACATESLRLGPLVTPLSRRRVQKLARETVTLDHLSNGRLTLRSRPGQHAQRRTRALRRGRRPAAACSAARRGPGQAGRVLGRRVQTRPAATPPDSCLGRLEVAESAPASPRRALGRTVPDRAPEPRGARHPGRRGPGSAQRRHIGLRPGRRPPAPNRARRVGKRRGDLGPDRVWITTA